MRLPKRLFISLLIAAIPAAALGGEYHTGQSLICSDCHIEHASIRGEQQQPEGFLLKVSGGEVPLCLSCHNGSNGQAPDIVSSGNSTAPTLNVSTSYQSKFGSSAGFFQGDVLTSENPFGHDLQRMGQTPLSNSFSPPSGLKCSSCHDPHGSANYRNLRSDPNPNHPGTSDVRLGVDVKESVAVNAISPNPAQAYDSDNVSFYATNNLNAWCADCHDQLSANHGADAPAHFMKHPVGVDMAPGNGRHLDVNNWLSGVIGAATGFGLGLEDGTSGVPRVRFGSPTGSNTAASSGDTVLCVTCHKAHGSKYKSAIAWPYRADANDSRSGCQQCHCQ